MKKNYDLSALMTLAWAIYRTKANKCPNFAEALRRAWKCFDVAEDSHKKVEDTAKRLGITEKVRSWYGWFMEGRKVMHDEEHVFSVILPWPERGLDKTRVVPYFTYSQTDLAENVA